MATNSVWVEELMYVTVNLLSTCWCTKASSTLYWNGLSFQCTLTILLPTLSGMRSITAAVNVTQASATTTNCPIIYQFAIVLDLQQLRQYCVNNTVHFKASVDVLENIETNRV